MPELPEVESYRALAEDRALGRTITEVRANDAWYLKGGADAAAVSGMLVGQQLLGARRRGKLLMLDVGSPPASGAADEPDSDAAVLGLRFGMSGRLVVDRVAGVGDLLYTTRRHNPLHDRFAVVFDDGGELVMHDPRRLGGVIIDPVEERLGPDARTLTTAQLRAALAKGGGPLKARLMDQARVAGIGNLLADEILWRAGLSPLHPAGDLGAPDLRRLRTHIVNSVERAIQSGGSHTGEFISARHRGGRCPRDDAELRREQVGGRTTYWCPAHQH